MYLPRVIPCLLLKSEALVKTQKFKNPSYIGDPINAVRIFNELEVDELIILDIEASRYRQHPNFEFLGKIVSEAFMPVAIGGGITSLEDASKLINLGVEKVVINSAALYSFKLIEDISRKFGSQSVVLSIDIKKNLLGNIKLYSHTDGNNLNVDIEKYISDSIRSGAGEVLINFVDNDGMGTGYNYNYIEKISKKIDVPLIVSGGAGHLNDFKMAVNVGASACAAGSMFVYRGRHRAVMINYPGYNTLKNLFNE